MQLLSIFGLAVLFGALLFNATHRSETAAPSSPLTDAACLRERYCAAIRDAAIAEPYEVVRELIAITPTNPQLVWATVPFDKPTAHALSPDAAKYVLMLTWTSWRGYHTYLKKPEGMRLSKQVWVTAVPELQDRGPQFAKEARTDAELALRLRQFLGLSPESAHDTFVEMWVRPDDLFRPCPDHEIDDLECSLDFPAHLSVDHPHRQWITELQQISYDADKGFPWTRLGYTYDWWSSDCHSGPQRRSGRSPIGASEFIVRAGARVFIQNVLPTAQYLRASFPS